MQTASQEKKAPRLGGGRGNRHTWTCSHRGARCRGPACRVRVVRLLDGAPQGVVLLLAAASWWRGDAPAWHIQWVD
jgi:hypothetical protein